MIPFGLKISWFILSLTGLMGCWLSLWSFGRVVGTKWASVVYCVGTTLTQGSFCLGVIYRMDPFLMADPFCLVQTAFISAGSFINMGVVLAFTLATSTAVRRPKTWGDARRALQWRKSFILPVIVVPTLAMIWCLAFSFSFRSVDRSDGLWCDSTSSWVQLLGPSGIPFLFAIPVLFITVQSFFRIRRINLHLLRSRPEFEISPTTLSRTGSQCPMAWKKSSRASVQNLVRIPLFLAASISRKSSAVSLRFWKGAGMKKNASASAVGVVEAQNEGTNSFRPGRMFTPSLPPTPLPLSFSRSGGGSSESSPNGSEIVMGNTIRIGGDGGRTILDEHDIALESRQNPSRLSIQDCELRDTSSTLFFPYLTFGKTPAVNVQSRSDLRLPRHAVRDPGPTTTPAAKNFRISVVDVARETACSRLDSQHSNPTTIDGDSLSVADVRRVDGKIELKVVTDVESAPAVVDTMDAEDGSGIENLSIPDDGKNLPSQMIFTLGGPYKRPSRQPAWLAPALWRVILFQCSFVFIQFLAFVPAVVDVANGRRTPSSFGSQYIALLLSAWCPVIVFSSLSVVRRNLVPWHPVSIS